MNAILEELIRTRKKPDGSVTLAPADVEAILNDEEDHERFVLRDNRPSSKILQRDRAKRPK